MEYAEGGDLLNRITSHIKHKTHFDEIEIWRILSQMLLGLKALHDMKIVHRDIKCANVFQTKEGIIKLGDLNVSKIVKVGFVHTQTGTPYYASPEIWKDKPYDYKSDMWSLGALLYELCSLSPPFKAQGLSALAQKVMLGKYSPIPKIYSDGLASVIKSLLQVDPHKRANCDQILITPNIVKALSNNQSSNLQSACHLIETIKVPRNLKALANNLPKPNYKNLDKNALNRGEIIMGSGSDKKVAPKIFEPIIEIPKMKPSSDDHRIKPIIKEEKNIPIQKNNYVARPFYANNQYISPKLEQNNHKNHELKKAHNDPLKKMIPENKIPLNKIVKSPAYPQPPCKKLPLPLKEKPKNILAPKLLHQVMNKGRSPCQNLHKNNLKENLNNADKKNENLGIKRNLKENRKYEMYDKRKMLQNKNQLRLKKY